MTMTSRIGWMMAGRIGWLGTVVSVFTAFTAFAAVTASAADPSEFTEAERLLFTRPHLAALPVPSRLHYRYQRSGTIEPEVSDEAMVDLAEIGGSRTATVQFLSGDRKLDLPPVDLVEGNPIILHFLEREVRELRRLTGGASAFYRNRIRQALAADATVTAVELTYDGKPVAGMRIRIEPYVNDPARTRFEKFAGRYYEMILSPDVPGEVYQLRAELAGAADGPEAGKIVHSEVLTFDRRD